MIIIEVPKESNQVCNIKMKSKKKAPSSNVIKKRESVLLKNKFQIEDNLKFDLIMKTNLRESKL